MLYFHSDTDGTIDAAATFEQLQANGLVNERGVPVASWIMNRNDIEDMAQAEEIARTLNNCHAAIGQTLYGAIDSGPSVSPRYDVIRLPQIGDEVSKAFNGDYYPVGKVVTISKTYKKITTDLGEVFYRKRQSARWTDGTFALVPGTISRRNPEF